MKIKPLFAAFALLAASGSSHAADHVDAPSSRLDREGDITDVFVFRANGKLVGSICFAGSPAPNPRVDGSAGAYDKDLLYRFNIDTNNDAKADITVQIRFGQNSKGVWGVELEGVPGAGARYVFGPVETVLKSPTGLKAYAGLRDDPFFFDVEGFNMTLATFGDDSAPDGRLMFNNKRDSFGKRNLTAIVWEMDLAAAAQGSKTLGVWATTERLVK